MQGSAFAFIPPHFRVEVRVDGAEAYATLSTVIQSTCLHGLNPERYLADVIVDLHFRRRAPSDLAPARYAARKEAEDAVKQPR